MYHTVLSHTAGPFFRCLVRFVLYSMYITDITMATACECLCLFSAASSEFFCTACI